MSKHHHISDRNSVEQEHSIANNLIELPVPQQH